MSHLYSTRTWRIIRRRVLRRDGHRCTAVEIYGDVEIRCPAVRNLEVHHIKRPEDGGAPYDEENLLTLCEAHHKRLERRLDPVRGRVRVPRRRARQRPNAGAYLNREQREARQAAEDERFADLVA